MQNRFTYTFFLLFGLTIILTACSSTSQKAENLPTGKGEYKVGNPYKVRGKWYYPKVQPDYNEVGIASWYGQKFHGRQTANGEIFDMNQLTAAHTTLPMPSYVRVTNLYNGRSLILRVNDRGPFAHGRIIDVSRQAASKLGFLRKGTQKVRVEVIPDARIHLANKTTSSDNTTDHRAAALSKSETTLPPKENTEASATEIAETTKEKNTEYQAVPIAGPTSPIKNEGTTDTKITPPTKTAYFIQAGAFSLKATAQKLADKLSHIGPSITEQTLIQGRTLYHVRIGPVEKKQTADILLGRILTYGYNTARIVQDRCDC